MGYTTTKGFQGWRTKADGRREHGNELTSADLSQFLFGVVMVAAAGGIIWFVFRFLRQLLPELLNRMTP